MSPPEDKAAAAVVVEEEEEDPEEDPEEEEVEEIEEEVEEEEEVQEIEEEVEEEEFSEIEVESVDDEEVVEIDDQEEEEEEEEDPEEEDEDPEEESWDNLPAAAEDKAALNCIPPVKEDADKGAEETPVEDEPWENLPTAAAAEEEEEEALEDKHAVNCIQPMKEDARNVDNAGEEKAGPSSSSFVLRSVTDLQILQGAISEFVLRWNKLHKTLDFIQSAIDHRSKELDALQRPSPSINAKELVVKEEEEDQGPADKRPSDAKDELVSICKSMGLGGKNLRRYIIKHIGEIDSLRRDLPVALRSVPDPANVVFLSVGRFYLQGSKCFENPNSAESNALRAVILLLEIYILSGCASELSLNPSVEEEALAAANAWMRRIVHEGGVRSATAKDALGLVLFMASFGIPPKFRCMDLYDLLHSCNLRKEAHVLRLSPLLLKKLPDIIKELIGKDMHVEAVNLICSFGLEEKFPPLPLLSSLCNRSSEIVGDEQGEEQKSIRSLIDINKKHLAVLKSVVKCLKENRLDPSLLRSVELSEEIAKTEKKILELLEQKQKEQSRNLKRVAEEAATCEVKRPRSASAQASSSAQVSLGIPPHSSKLAQDLGGAAPIGSRGSQGGFHPQNLFGGVYTGWHNGDLMRAAAGSQPVPSQTAVHHRHVSSSANEDGKGSSASNLYHFADYVP